MMESLGIIPARGESKGIPRKNIKPLGGRPLIFYTIKAALKSKLSRVIVSTDDREIAKIAKNYNAEVPFLRPKKLANDKATAISVVMHALNYLEKEENYYPNIIAYLQPTSPFRTSKHINLALKLLLKSDCDSVIGVCKVEHHPYFMYKKNKEGKLEEIIKIKNKPERRQDLPIFYRINDALTITRREYFTKGSENSFVFNPRNMKGLMMDKVSSIDINDEFDFKLAEFIISSGLFKLNLV